MVDMTPCKCLDCGYALEEASDPQGKGLVPRAGDISLCLECGHLMAFNADLTVRELNDAEMHAIAGDPFLLAVQHARGKVWDEHRRLNGGKKRPPKLF